ncbi:ATP-binding protein [Aquisalimonas sp.]|uniref:sensor histidine kinase n=1 Tax=Aquisalimonas sp. TaxID=1872621 RepID=UPI0025BEB102|nr:ATP-binding protein [Aquisalimonas sp.]
MSDHHRRSASTPVTSNAEDSLHHTAQEARHVALGEMVGIIGHQWRQPLTSLSIMLEELQVRYHSGELEGATVDDLVGRAQGIIGQLDQTVEDFTRFLYPQSEPGLFQVAEATRMAVNLIEPALVRAGVRVNLAVAPDLSVRGFRNELSQVLLSLLQNVAEAFPSGAHDRQVSIEACRAEQQVRITVSDNAGGIPDAVLPHLFEPYFTTKAAGTGIGLRLAKLLVDRSLGGSISAANGPLGAEFVISLPLATGD